MQAAVLAKMYDMGVLNSDSKLSDIENKLTVSAFCKRRLAVVMCQLKMAETVSSVSLLLFDRIFSSDVHPDTHNRLLSLSSKGTFEWGPIASLTRHSSSLGTDH